MKGSEKFIQQWGKTRKKGQMRYVLIWSILMALGIFTGSVLGSLLNKGPYFIENLLYVNGPYFLGGLVGGAIGALGKWSMNEEKYNHLVNKNNE